MPCEVCGFRAELWDDQDRERTLLMAPHLAAQVSYPDPPEVSVDGLDDVHEVLHLLHVAGRSRHATTPTAAGVVAQLSTSRGGVPKAAVRAASVDGHGLDTDRQADRANHGRPWQAVCLWSAEVIEALQDEGHPIGFGSAGENVTVSGLDWATVTPGLRLLVGPVLLEVTSYAIPCAKNSQWFSDGGFRRMAHDVRPGQSRVYAAVLREGVVSHGDPVVVEP